MKKHLHFLALFLTLITTASAQTFIKKGLSALPIAAPVNDTSAREARFVFDPVNPRLSGLYGVRAGKANQQWSVSPDGIKQMLKDSNTVLRGLTWPASKITSGIFSASQIPNLGMEKITNLNNTLAIKADLDGNGKVPLSQLSAVVISDVFVVNTQAAMLALTAERGDIAIRSDLNKTLVLSTDSPTTLADWKELPTPTAAVSSVAGKTGAVSLVKADVGLGNADNTSDASKPVSTAQQTALDLKADNSAFSAHTSNTANPHSVTKSQVGLGNADNTSDLNKPVSTAQQTALNLKADASSLSAHTSNTSNPHSVTKSQVGLGNVDNTSDLNKPISTATQSALDGKAASSHNHTSGQVSDFSEAVDDRVAALITAGSNTTVTYNDAANTLTISAASGGGGISNTKRAYYGQLLWGQNFLGAGTGTLSLVASGSGAGTSYTSGTPVGLFGITTGTTTTGSVFLGTSNNFFIPNSSLKIAVEGVINIPNFSDGTDTYQAVLGFLTSTGNAGNYVGWALHSSSIRARSVISSATQGTELGSGTQSVNTNYRFRVEFDGNTAKFWMKTESDLLADIDAWPWALDGSDLVGTYTNGVAGIAYASGPWAVGLFNKKSAGTNPRIAGLRQLIYERVY